MLKIYEKKVKKKQFNLLKTFLQFHAIGFSALIFLILTTDSIISLITDDKKVKLGTYVLFILISFAAVGFCASAAVYREVRKIRNFEKNLLIEYEEKFKYSEFHDRLTGLYNWMALNERIDELLRQKSSKYAVLLLDIDNFKYINDTMGYNYGDLLLTKISKRLSAYNEETATLYRLGGDEFVILVEDFKDMDEVTTIAREVLSKFKNPMRINNNSIFVTVSIGIALSPFHGATIDDLLKNADIAVNKAKEAGKKNSVVYNELMNKTVSERVHIEKCLHTALENKEFELYYQPQLDIRTGKISGFEALLRWNSSELGFVLPDKFIGIAEDTHLIIPIGQWVLLNACRFIKKFHKRGYEELSISVNISILEVLQNDFVDNVLEILSMTELCAEYLELEITETMLMKSYNIIADKLEYLRDKGVKIALDDFGKGYSSLNYLRELPITTLKIDKSFIDSITTETKNKSLTDLIVKAGKRMDLCVVAEGVENQEQMDYLVKYQCNKIQGYLFSRPLSEKKAESVLIEIMKEVAL